MTSYLIIWGAVFVVMVIAELSTMQLVSIWFAAGAAAAFAATLMNSELWLQLTVFALVSIVLLVVTRPLLKRFTVRDKQPTNMDMDLGKTATVIEDIDNALGKGRARLNDVDWKAVSADGSPISKGTIVTIREIRGTKLYVSRERFINENGGKE